MLPVLVSTGRVGKPCVQCDLFSGKCAHGAQSWQLNRSSEMCGATLLTYLSAQHFLHDVFQHSPAHCSAVLAVT